VRHIGEERIQKLSEPQLLKLYGKLLAEGRVKRDRAAVRRYRAGIVPKQTSLGLAPTTVRNVHTLIHRALPDTVAWKYI
jgi:hypothetical protein